MGEIEGVGEVVTGGLIASAIEPEAGGDGRAGSSACLNCGTTITSLYCPACGQKARVHRSLATFFHDMLQGMFNFEGKIWRTLPMLAWRPGEMTRRYIDGQRTRFVSPVALYLFSVFLMFAVLNFTGSISRDLDSVATSLNKAAAEERIEIARLEAERKAALARPSERAAIDRRIAGKKDELVQLERVRQGTIITIDETDGDTGPQWLRNAGARIQQNPQAFILKVQDATSKFSWLLIPLSVPFLWLLFPLNRRFHLYDHTVFVTYSLSFMMMLVIAGGLLVSIGIPSVASFLIFIPPLHMYRQLKGTYGLSRTSALLRTLALVSFAFVASTLFFLAMLGIGIL